MTSEYKGECDCGQIQFETKGEPLFTQYCHCNKCREVASHSTRKQDKVGYSHTAAYLTANFTIHQGQDHLIQLHRNNAYLYECDKCHTLIYGISTDPQMQQGIGINANNIIFADIPPVSFKSVRHVYYADRIIDIEDDLPKYVDFPKELGGSDKQLKP